MAEDPNGLDREELLRLVKESLPITSFKKVRDMSDLFINRLEGEREGEREETAHPLRFFLVFDHLTSSPTDICLSLSPTSYAA